MEAVSTDTSAGTETSVGTETQVQLTKPGAPARVEGPGPADAAGLDPDREISDAELMRIALDAAVEAIRPAIQMDGGDMIVHELRHEEGVVDIELIGACVGCPMSSVTLKQGVERILTDRVPGLKKVRAKGIDYDVVEDAW
jgi:Fe-S cluster biogenesis protein NfuA